MWNFFYPLAITYLQLLLGETLFLLKAPRRNKFLLRVVLSGAASVVTIVLYVLLMQAIDGKIAGMFAYVFVWLLTGLNIYICFDISPINIIFVSTGSYALQHMGYSVNIFFLTIIEGYYEIQKATGFIFPFVFMGLAYILVLHRNKELYRTADIRQIFIAFLLLIICIVLNSIREVSPADLAYVTIYDFLCCLCCLFIQFSISRNERVQQDNKTLITILNKEHEQHELSNQAVSMMNIKFHDLKNQIDRLQELISSGIEINSFEEIKRAVQIYGSRANSGNPTLDALLMEKGLICEMNGIQFSYIADGKLLGFMEAVDIFSLFNNMLDNAIESVLKEENKEKRVIIMRVSRSAETLLIGVENYCKETLDLLSGLPVTTKKDNTLHGIGMKGICFVVNKYGGSMRLSLEDRIFRINIVFACDESEKNN